MALNNSINAPIPLSLANGGTNGLTDGQVIIGSTGNPPVAATLTAGGGIAIVNTPGGIEISATGEPLETWTTITSNTNPVALVKDHSYVANVSGGAVNFTLPATAALGDTFYVYALGAGLFDVALGASTQVIRMGTVVTTTGSGLATATEIGDFVQITCVAAPSAGNETFALVSLTGQIDITG